MLIAVVARFSSPPSAIEMSWKPKALGAGKPDLYRDFWTGEGSDPGRRERRTTTFLEFVGAWVAGKDPRVKPSLPATLIKQYPVELKAAGDYRLAVRSNARRRCGARLGRG